MSLACSGKLGVFLLLASATGCVHQRAHSICRVWADWNTLAEPAVLIERIEHLPYRSAQVGHFRWMYGLDPGHAYGDPLTETGALLVPVRYQSAIPSHSGHDPNAELAPPPADLDVDPLDPDLMDVPPMPDAGQQPPSADPVTPGVPPLPSTYRDAPSADARGSLRRSMSHGVWLWRSAHRGTAQRQYPHRTASQSAN